MAKVDLSSLEWCDLIFSGKNKAYGAYKMREDSPRRHNIAVILVIVIALIGFSIPTLIKMATPKQKEVMTEVTTLSQLEEPEVKQEEMKRVEPVAPPPPALKSSIKFTAPVIKKDEEVRDLKQVVTQAPEEEEKVFDMVEQMPTFPGGTNELMKYIADHLKYPTIAQENGVEGRVICQFVVSSDGRVRDAKVVKTLDPYCDKEAIRVIMSMPKWIPGKQNGKAVSVKYTVPIVFRLQ